MSHIQYDRVFTGRKAGDGSTEIDTGLGHNYYTPDSGASARLKGYAEATKFLDPTKH